MENTEQVQVMTSNLLPSVVSLINELRERLAFSKSCLEEADNLIEEVLRKDEIKKIEVLIQDLEGKCKDNNNSDVILENTFQSLEINLQSKVNLINSKINNRSILDEKLIKEYNDALLQFNLFFNVVDSIY